jgi:hypothetical protein
MTPTNKTRSIRMEWFKAAENTLADLRPGAPFVPKLWRVSSIWNGRKAIICVTRNLRASVRMRLQS